MIRNGGYPGDSARGPRLFARLAGELFYCETCKSRHPLRELRKCRARGSQGGKDD